MAQEDKISSIIDQTAIDQELKALDGRLANLATTLKNFPQLQLGQTSASLQELTKNNAAYQTSLQTTQQAVAGVTAAEKQLVQVQQQAVVATQQQTRSLEQNIKGFNDYKSAIAANSAAQKQLKQDVDAGRISADEYRKKLTELSADQVKLKARSAELGKEIRTQAKDATGVNGAYAKLNQEYLIAQKRAKDLASAYGIQDVRAVAASKTAGELDARLKEIDKTVGQSQRNVGNYGSAFEQSGKQANASFDKISNGAKKAFSGLRTIANILPGFGLSGVILLLLTPLEAVGKAFVDLFTKVDTTKQKFAALNEVAGAGSTEFKNAVTEVVNLRIAFEQANAGIIKQEEAVKLYNDTVGKTAGSVKSLNEAEAALAKNAEAYIQFTLLKAQANFALGKAAESAFKIQEIGAKRILALQQLEGNSLVSPDLINETFDKAADEAKKEADAYFKIFEDLTKKVQDLGVKNNLDFNGIAEPKTKTGSNKPRDPKDDTARQILEAQKAIDELAIKQQLDKDKRIIDNENKTYQERISALRRFTFNSQQLIELDRQYATAIEKEKLAETLRGLAEQRKVKGANVKLISQIEEGERRASAKRIELIDRQALDRTMKLTDDLIKEQRRLKDERNKVRLEEQKQIDDYEEFTLKQLKGYYNAVKKADEDEAKRKSDLLKKGAEEEKKLRRDLYKELISALSQFIADGFTREEQALEERSRLLDEETQRRINQVNQLGLSETERVKRVAAIEKDAQFQREQIEKRQRKLAVERAKFEKAANIAQIIASTAAAIIETLKTYKGLPIGFAIAASIGAIGALQLAKAISTPLPRYAKGGTAPTDQIAIVNDAGKQEFIGRTDGTIEAVQGRNVLMDLKKGDHVYPDFGALAAAMGGQQPLATIKGKVEQASRLEEQMDSLLWVNRQILKKPVPETHIHGIDNVWYNQHIKY